MRRRRALTTQQRPDSAVEQPRRIRRSRTRCAICLGGPTRMANYLAVSNEGPGRAPAPHPNTRLAPVFARTEQYGGVGKSSRKGHHIPGFGDYSPAFSGHARPHKTEQGPGAFPARHDHTGSTPAIAGLELVEVAGIEPASFVASTGLLRAQCALSLLDPTGLAHEPA